MDPPVPEHGARPSVVVTALLGEFFDRRAAGEVLSPQEFAAQHPAHSDALLAHLAGLPLIEHACSTAAPPDDGQVDAGRPLPQIAGHELLEEVGRGGMGVVYRARQLSTKRIVALKVMLAGPFASASARRRFDREVELAARLQHPGIVRVLESGEVAGQRYYAMDFVSGRRLDEHVRAAAADAAALLRLVIELCEAVQYAHEHGVIHRDLKPGNVLIDETGAPHILDFGLAKATDPADSSQGAVTSVSLPGQVVGTLYYLSPEQAAGAPEGVDARTDVYALGLMLYEALCGSLPYTTDGRPSEIIERILEAPPARLAGARRTVDAELETIVFKALEKDRARRYQTARQLADDLERYLAGEPILARRPSSLYVLRKKVWKHRAPVALALALVAVLVAGWSLRARAAEAQRLFARREAVRLLVQLDYGEAGLPAAEALYTQFPDLPEVMLVWAQALYRNVDARERAVVNLEGALQRDPAAWYLRALLAEIYTASGNAGRAEELRAQTELAMPDTADAWFLRSLATLDRTAAREYVARALEREEDHPLALSWGTWLRLDAGDLDGAFAGAERLIALGEDPGRWELVKGQVYARQGRFREAVEHYTRCGDLLRRAHAYRRLGEWARAEEDYTRILERNAGATTDVWTLYQRATPRWILGRTVEALGDYQRVRVLLGRPFYSDVRRFFLLQELGRGAEADALARQCLGELSPGWLHRIFRCLAGEITPRELVASPLAQSDAEMLCEAYYYAGEMCLLRGERDDACHWFDACVRTGLEFDPNTALGTPMNEFELAQWRLRTRCPDAPITGIPAGK